MATPDQFNEKLADRLPVQSVSDLPGFPFATHAEFAEAFRRREVLIAKQFDLRFVFHAFGRFEAMLWAALAFNGYAAGLGLAAYGVMTSNYWLLLAIPLGILSVLSAGPMMACCELVFFCFPFLLTGLVLWPFFPQAGMTISFLAVVFTVSRAVSQVGVGVAAMEMEDTVPKSEPLLIWLLCRRVIAIYDKRQKLIYEYNES